MCQRVKIDYLLQKYNHKFLAPHPAYLGLPSNPILKYWIRHCCAPLLKMKSRRLCICVSSHFVCILLGSFCKQCFNVW